MAMINSTIKKALFSSPWRYSYIAIVFLYFVLDYYTNEIYLVGFKVFHYNPAIAIPFLTFTILNGLLVGLTINLAAIRFRQLHSFSQMGTGTATSILGTMGALLAGACPGCIAGLLPVVLGLFGARSFTLAQLPFYGVEVLIISFILLLTGAYMLSRPVTCKI